MITVPSKALVSMMRYFCAGAVDCAGECVDGPLVV